MAYGHPPKHTRDFELDGFTNEQFLTLAVEAAKKLKWNVGTVSEQGFVAHTPFSMSSWSEEVSVQIDGNTARLKSFCTGNQAVDWGKNKRNIENLLAKIGELKETVNIDDLSRQYTEMVTETGSSQQDELTASEPETTNKTSGLMAIFKPAEGYYITPIIIILNILVFIVMIISGVHFIAPDSESLINWGANFRPATLNGEWWRLLTCCFLHIGIFHLLMNIYALLYIGMLLEPLLGKARFLSAYLLTGVVASLSSLWWHDFTVSAGASGAVFGMYGVFLALLTTNLIDAAARKSLLTSIMFFVGYNLLYGIKGGIDNAAHIGGLVSGLLVGYALVPGLRKQKAGRPVFVTLGLMAVIAALLSYGVIKKLPNDFGLFDAKMKEFERMEKRAMDVFNMPENTPGVEQVRIIRDTGIYYWNENIKLINSCNDLSLPAYFRNRNKLLTEYCELRIRTLELVAKGIAENSDEYNMQIKSLNDLVLQKLKELGEEGQ